MKKGKKHLLMSWTMALIMLLNVFPFRSIAYAEGSGTDKTSELTNFKATISQNGTEIGEGGTLASTAPISVEISFGVPVEGDNPTPDNPVKKGDTATFQLSTAFKSISSDKILLKSKSGAIPVGHVSFTTDAATNMVVAHVIFDGDDTVFDGTYNTAECRFDAEFEYDASGESGNVGDHIVTILEKTYTVAVPPVEIEYKVTKSGRPDLANKCIEWTVDVSATQSGENIDLSGYQFYDDLSAVGTYIPDSFKVDSSSEAPTVENNTILYSFPEGSKSPKQITFKTEISDSAYYATSEQKITNKAQLQDSEKDVVAEGQIEVKFTPKWIEKAGKSSDSGSSGIYDPTNRTITWTIIANHMGASLNNVVITDVLPAGLTLKEANWQAWNGSAWGSAIPITPNASGEYALGDINSKILLTIITNVPDEDFSTGIKTYRNSASIQWDGLSGPGLGTGNIGVGVGYNAIKKSGEADSANRSIHWTVTVDAKGQTIPDLKVYDLLVYGSSTSGFDLTKVTGIPTGIKATDLTPRYDQKYVLDSFAGTTSAVKVNPIPIMQDGKQVADLLEITGLSTDVPDTFTFDSLIVNPNIFAGNKTSKVWNTATLFSANAKLNLASDDVDYTNKSLSKEMLNRTAMNDPAASVNTDITKNLNDGFDYQDKSVIFRLSINADGIDLSHMTNADGQTLGAATVTDTLPEGWVFSEIVAGSNYLIFEGNGNANGTVLAKDTTPDSVPGLNATFSGRTATFTFDSLNKPYVILVKARPTSETAATYFNTNKTTTERNNLSLKTENWTPGVTSFQDIAINSRLLEKTLDAPKVGELLWTVEYRPYNLSQLGTKLKDTLPAGIDLRTDSSGALLLSDGNITAHEMTLNADGSYTIGAEVALKLGENISYDNETRILNFIIPNNTKAYRFSYLTDITGEPGSVSNKVSLYGNNSKQEESAQPYVITETDGEASLKKNGWISITKIDGAGATLAGAEFTIFALDGQTVIRTGVTGSDGTVKFKVIPDGEYLLRETASPEGYTPENTTHTLSVTTTGETVVTSIDGKTGKNSNAITIQNFLENTMGNLTISKTVAGNAVDTSKKFEFTLTLADSSGSSYTYIGNGLPNGTIKSGDTISLAHNQSITVIGLPKGTTYTVAEADYSDDGYSQVNTGASGTIVADTTQTASFTNTKNVVPPDPTGNLTISKTVSGNAADATKKFNFLVVFDVASGIYPFTGNGVPNGTIKSGDTLSLAHGQSITITGLPKGTTYTVTEADYSDEGYSKTSTGESGTITANATQTAAFTNVKNEQPSNGITGSLTISKKVTGNAADTTRKFDFTVTFNGASDSYTYTGNGVPNGTIKSGDTVSLAHGQSITIKELPEGTTYTVTEADYSGDGYSKSSTNATGSIVANTTQTASFINTRNVSPKDPVGSLTIKKTVTGDLGDRTQAFTFVVDFNVGGSYHYSGSNSGTIESGQSITLKHGEYIVINNLPVGTTYQVTEKESDKNGYSANSTGASGTITESGQTAAFVNTKSSVPKTGDDSLSTVWSIGLIGSAIILMILIISHVYFRNKHSKRRH